MHLHPAYFVVLMVGLVAGPVLSMPVATVIGAALTSSAVVIAAWLQRRRNGK